MSNCCGQEKKPEQKEIGQPGIKGGIGQESFWKKLLGSLGLKRELK